MSNETSVVIPEIFILKTSFIDISKCFYPNHRHFARKKKLPLGRRPLPRVAYSPTRTVYSHVYIIYSPPAPNILSDLKQENFVVVSSSYCFITAMAASTDST